MSLSVFLSGKRSLALNEYPFPGLTVLPDVLESVFFTDVPEDSFNNRFACPIFLSFSDVTESKFVNKTDISNIITATADDSAETNPSIISVTKR